MGAARGAHVIFYGFPTISVLCFGLGIACIVALRAISPINVTGAKGGGCEWNERNE